MKFNSKQILFVSIALVIIISLFAMGYKTPFGQHGSKGVSGAVVASSFNVDEYVELQKDKLTPEQKTAVENLEAKDNNKDNLASLATLWDSLNVGFVGAHYAYKLAEQDQTEMTWYIAGSKFYNVANFSNDSQVVDYAVKQAKNAFGKVLDLNPANLEAKNALAICIIQDDQDVMKGVSMLKEVVATDSNNVQAIFTLGMLSMQSAQFDKAVERFEKLVKLHPFNAEYYFYLGEALVKSGDVKKAIKTYETCKTLVNDKQAKQEVQDIINKLNKL